MTRCPPSARTLSGHRWVFQGKTSTACRLARNGSLYSANSRPGLALQEALELGPAPLPFPTLAASTACGVRIFLSVPPCGTLSQLAGRALCSIQHLACRPSSSASGWGHCRDPCPKGAWWQGGGGRWKIPETSSPHTTCWGHHTAAGQPFPKAPWAGASPPWVPVVGAHLLDAMGSVIPRPAIWGSVASVLFHNTLQNWRPSGAAPLSFPWPLVEKVWVTSGDPRKWLPLIGARLVCLPPNIHSPLDPGSPLRVGCQPPLLRAPFSHRLSHRRSFRPCSPEAAGGAPRCLGPCGLVGCGGQLKDRSPTGSLRFWSTLGWGTRVAGQWNTCLSAGGCV